MSPSPSTRRPSRALLVGLCAGALIVPTAGPAAAHGLGDDTVGRSVPDFVPIGIEHMLLGWDHLLFIVAVVLLGGTARRAAKLVSLFAAGHSLTLVVATLAEWRVDPDVVDVVIAGSIVYVGAVGVRGAPYNWTLFGIGVFAFGLVHGLGLSTRFQETGLPDDGRLARLIAFNVGIEIGQLLAIAAVVLFGLLLLDVTGRREAARRPDVVRGANAVVLVVGLIVTVVMTTRAARSDAYDDLAAASAADCDVRRQEAPPVLEGGHPARSFFAPGEAYAEADFGHVVGDGLVVIRYRDTLSEVERRGIRDYVDATRGVVAGAVAGQTNAVEITTQRRVLTCVGFDLDTVRRFGDLWLREIEHRALGSARAAE